MGQNPQPCSGARRTRTPEGKSGTSDALPSGAPGFPADNGVLDRSCKVKSSEREMKMTPAIREPADDSHHNTLAEVTFLGVTPSEISEGFLRD